MSENPKETGKEPSKSPDAGTVPAADPQTPTGATPVTAAKAPAGAKPAAPAAAKVEAPPPPPPEPGEMGQKLKKGKIAFTPLGNDGNGVEMISVAPDALLKAGGFLRDNCQFDLMLSCAGVDWKDRLESVYHLYSTVNHNYLAVKVTADNGHSPSLTPVWPAANWQRETYDLLGIHYDGHPDLARILMPIDWIGHPLRKDYKVDDPRLVWNER